MRASYGASPSSRPYQAVPRALTTTATLGRSQGPRQPEIVSWTPRFSFSAFQIALIRSTGTAGRPRSVRPQQHPLQSNTCAGDLTRVVKGVGPGAGTLESVSVSGASFKIRSPA